MADRVLSDTGGGVRRDTLLRQCAVSLFQGQSDDLCLCGVSRCAVTPLWMTVGDEEAYETTHIGDPDNSTQSPGVGSNSRGSGGERVAKRKKEEGTRYCIISISIRSAAWGVPIKATPAD